MLIFSKRALSMAFLFLGIWSKSRPKHRQYSVLSVKAGTAQVVAPFFDAAPQ
jgi:hypothetical protein